MHRRNLLVWFGVGRARFSILFDLAKGRLTITYRCLWRPIIVFKNSNFTQDIRPCTIFVLAIEVFIDLSDLVSGFLVTILVAEPSLKLVLVFLAVHSILAVFPKRRPDNGDGILQTLGKFVFTVLLRNIADIKQGSLCNESISRTKDGDVPTNQRVKKFGFNVM